MTHPIEKTVTEACIKIEHGIEDAIPSIWPGWWKETAAGTSVRMLCFWRTPAQITQACPVSSLSPCPIWTEIARLSVWEVFWQLPELLLSSKFSSSPRSLALVRCKSWAHCLPLWAQTAAQGGKGITSSPGLRLPNPSGCEDLLSVISQFAIS